MATSSGIFYGYPQSAVQTYRGTANLHIKFYAFRKCFHDSVLYQNVILLHAALFKIYAICRFWYVKPCFTWKQLLRVRDHTLVTFGQDFLVESSNDSYIIYGNLGLKAANKAHIIL